MRRYAVAALAVGLLLLPLCFWRDPGAGVLSLALFGALMALSLWHSRQRYRQIAELSRQLERFATGDRAVDIGAYTEGELSILSSELLKLTSALSHRMEHLQRDRTFLSETLADISHQLKTPLTTMTVMADLLENPDLPEDKRLEFLQGIRVSLDRMQWLITALLKLSRLDAGAVTFQTEPVALAEVARQAAAPLLIPAETRNQTLVVDVADDAIVDTDRRWLAEAVGNLIKNCIEHTPEGGTIRVKGTRNALYTDIRVSDDGPGFTAEDLPHIFERFYRGKDAAADSVGIGLALTKSIVGNLGGTVTAANLPGGGACFCIKLYGKTVV